MSQAAVLFPPRKLWLPRQNVAGWIDVSNWQGALDAYWFKHWSEQGFGGLIVTHVPDFLANSETVMALGMRPSAKNVSASFCCSTISPASIGLMP